MQAIIHEERLAMSPLIQICVVIVTMALVAIVTMAVIAMIRLGAAAERLTSAAQVSMAQVERIVAETRDILASAREAVSPTRRVVNRFQQLGERAADLSNAVLSEVESPVYTAVAVARGVRTGAVHLLDLLNRRLSQPSPSNNGDTSHEREPAGHE